MGRDPERRRPFGLAERLHDPPLSFDRDQAQIGVPANGILEAQGLENVGGHSGGVNRGVGCGRVCHRHAKVCGILARSFSLVDHTAHRTEDRRACSKGDDLLLQVV